MASLPFWDSEDEGEASAWDECELGGVLLPGLSDVRVKPKRKLDVQEGSGTDYDSVADKGQRSADVKVVVRMWERAHWERWQDEVIPKIWPAAGKGKAGPLDIAHPRAALYRVTSFVIADIDDDIDDGVMTVTLSGFAWGKPKPSPVKVADKSKGGGADKPDPNKAAEQAPFNPEASILDEAVKSLDPTGRFGKPKGQGAPSRDPNLLKP